MTSRVVHVLDRLRDSVYVGRRNNREHLTGSPLANPFSITKATPRATSLSRYAVYLSEKLAAGDPDIIDALIACRNKPLACWCRRDCAPWTLETACHADLIIEYLGRFSDSELRAMRPTAGASGPEE